MFARRSALPMTLHELNQSNERSNTSMSARPEDGVNFQNKRVTARSRGSSKGGIGGASWSKSDVKQVTAAAHISTNFVSDVPVT